MPQIISPENVMPEFANPLEVLSVGPLLPFDYCYLTGMKIGLILEVQMELVLRNPHLVVVDRSPLGVDPNAALSRCYLAFGNPAAHISVFNFYETDVCRGVPLDYFARFGVLRHLDDVYWTTGWVEGKHLTDNAQKWLEKYHRAMNSLCGLFTKLEGTAEITEALERFAFWLIPSIFFVQNANFKNDCTVSPKETLNFWRKILGDFTILSVVNRTTFCVLASIEELFFKDSLVGTKHLHARPELFTFKPRFIKTASGIGIVSLILWSAAQNSSLLVYLLISIVSSVSLGIFVVNLIFWLFFTMSPLRLRNLVPSKWKVPLKKIPGYLK